MVRSNSRVRLGWCPVVAAIGLACRPTPSPSPPAPSTSASASAARSEPSAPTPEATPGEPEAPRGCALTLELLEPGGVTGRGRSSNSSQEARDAAWADACTQLQKARSLDCHDDQVAVRKESSATIGSKHGSGSVQQTYRFTVELTTRRWATGRSEPMVDHEAACRAAKEDACRQLVGGPCPAHDVRVLEVDGHPPRAVAPAPSAPPPAQTPM